MRKIFSLDRIEGDIAVCISDDGIQIDVPTALLGEMKAKDVFSAEVEGEALSMIAPMPEERDRRLEANRARLQRLFDRNKKSPSAESGNIQSASGDFLFPLGYDSSSISISGATVCFFRLKYAR